MSCPILSNITNKMSDAHDYKNDEFLDEITTMTSEGKREFKLDKLLDINPKRLYKGSKFRCRIHDVIDQKGRFWIEVIYSKEDERKFLEIFKLFRLCARINQPPVSVHPKMCVGALYKDEWYRAIVLEPTSRCIVSNKVRVRFVFFNCWFTKKYKILRGSFTDIRKEIFSTAYSKVKGVKNKMGYSYGCKQAKLKND